jgi:nucleotide-binding universal stress UspA family protein
MPVFKHILFPVDFSVRCNAFKPSVLSMATQFGATLTLMHSVQLPAAWYSAVEASYAALLDMPALKEDLRKQLETYLETPDPSITITSVVEEGDPANCAVAFAEKHNVDLIMMPTHGCGLFRRLLLGSVTAKILHDAKCAVWTSAHSEDGTTAGLFDGKSIICAIDLSPESVNLIRYADDLARRFSAKLRLVHAVAVIPARHGFRSLVLQEAHDRILNLQKEAGTNLDVKVEGGVISTVVSNAAQRFDGDLVVIGRGGLQHTLGRLRTNAYSIIRDSPCPVLSI